MNYKVMQRPMFKLGGKAASQGTGITSGLDEKVNMAIGGGVIKGDNLGAREGFQQPDLSSMSLEDLINLQQQNYNKSMSRLGDMRDIVKLQALGNLATNVLPNIESRGLRGVVDFFRDPITTQTAIGGLTGLKQVDLKEKELQSKGLDKALSGKIALKKLDIDEKRALTRTATQVKLDASNKARNILEQAGVTDGLQIKDPLLQSEYFSLSAIAGDTISRANAQKLAVAAVLAQQEKDNEVRAEQGLKAKDYTEAEFGAKVQFLVNQYLSGSFGVKQPNASGGRVGRMLGSPMTGEQPMMNPMAVEKKDVAMETEGQGNDAYAMLRARLPQEIPDDVVRLIAYNKEAFADFASIKNQEDVSSFNQKYGVSMNIDVSTL
jgi:hypothetical protein